MASNHPRPHEFYNDSDKDVKMSLYEYYDMLDALVDDSLTQAGQMKFKELYRCNSYQMLVVPTVSFPIAWYLTKAMFGRWSLMQAS